MRAPEKEDEDKLVTRDSNVDKHIPATSGNTLLPRSVASLVSFIAHSTSLSLRIGTFFGGVAIDGARATTLTGLELSRAVVEGILSRAGRDVAIRSTGEYGRAEAESLLERSLAILHSTITSASFFASTSFHFSSAALTSFATLSQNLLFTLDAILGSTESSRAIAAIITLIRREFRPSDTVEGDEKVGVADLLVGSVGFALLQRWGQRKTERDIRDRGGDQIIWDVVILDNGLRADVVGSHHMEFSSNNQDAVSHRLSRPTSFYSTLNADEPFEAVRRGSTPIDLLAPHINLSAESQHQISDDDIRRYVMNQLPPGAHATVRTETVTARTITVDIFDDDVPDIAAPPGTTMVAESFHHDPAQTSNQMPNSLQRLPKHTVVFRTGFNQLHSADLRPEVLSNPGSELNHPDPDQIATGLLKLAGNDNAAKPDVQPQESPNATEDGPKSPPIRGKSSNTMSAASSISGSETPKSTFGKASLSRIAQKVRQSSDEKTENKTPQLKKATRKASNSLLSTSAKGGQKPERVTGTGNSPSDSKLSRRPPSLKLKKEAPRPAVRDPKTNVGLMNKKLPRIPQLGNTKIAMRGSPRLDERNGQPPNIPPRGPSRSGYYSIHEKNRESFIAQTDTYSLRSVDSRPGSPALSRTHVRSNSALSKSHAGEVKVPVNSDSRPTSSSMSRRKSTPFVPSICSLENNSETSLILHPRPRKNVFEDEAIMEALNRDGRYPGIFPHNHLVHNIRRFLRFSSASYGANFLRVMGISAGSQGSAEEDEYNHHEHNSFSNHTGLPASTILLSSHVDPGGGSNSAGETSTGFPLVHYLSLDHESKAVVLALRGTWGFEDILTDMTCDYDDLQWQGKTYQVHKGMHASATRLLEGGSGRVMATIKAALEEFPEYGVVFCGHSLGGGVAALLATLIAVPNTSDPAGPSFVTESTLSAARPLLLTANMAQKIQQPPPFTLPAGRPIHVYAYGPPAVMSPFLRRATRGLITTVVNGQDIVPSLSLGVLHDFHSVSLAFKSDVTGAKSHVRSRVWDGITQSILNKFYVNQPPLLVNAGDGFGDDTSAWSTLQSLRDCMVAPKLMPPGEVFCVDTMRVLQRDAFTSEAGNDGSGYPRLGRPATRVQLKFIRDVETWFGEIRFGSGMLGDHNPARYEASLAVLTSGVLEE